MKKNVTNIHGEIFENETLRLMGQKYCKRKRIIYLIFAYICVFFFLIFLIFLLGSEEEFEEILSLVLGSASSIIFFFFMAYIIYGPCRYLKYGVSLIKIEKNILPAINNVPVLKSDKVITLNRKPKNVFYMNENGNFQLYLLNKYSKVYKIEELLDFEIKVDTQTVLVGQSVTKGKTTGGLGSSLLGGAVLGAPGLIAGAVVGKRQTKTVTNQKLIEQKNSTYSLLLRINDLNNPSIIIKIETFEIAEQITAILLIMLEKKNKNILEEKMKVDESLNEDVEEVDSKNDKFLEIRRFKELMDEGIITEQDFEKKKKEILAL